jgi:A/G-specific adenine glycosylase
LSELVPRKGQGIISDMSEYVALHKALIAWFSEHQADLPWRHTRDPYTVWLSEIMLQQTQVAAVIGYYERFVARFPSVEALANASLDEVLKSWEGLGYYSRARNLHRTAKIVAAEHGGKFPDTVEGLIKLPGIGRYTAGAIASLAFGVDAPLLDGNVIRVLSRLFNIEEDVTQPETLRKLWALAEEILPSGQAALWNEGLMELGRVICTPRSPDCLRCPMNEHCQAYKLGVQEQRPVKTPKAKTPHYDVTAGVIRRADGKILIAQRPVDKMLGGLWEFPGGKRHEGESLPDCLRREIDEELRIEIAVGHQIATVRHGYTHFSITLYAFECRHIGGEPQAIGCAAFAWVSEDQLDAYAFPVTDRKIIAAMQAGGQIAMDLG